MGTYQRNSALCLAAMFTLAAPTASYARNCPHGTGLKGSIVETADSPAMSNITLTDDSTADIGSGSINNVPINRPTVNGRFSSAPVPIPDQVNTPDGPVAVCDVTQAIKILDPPLSAGGEIADLSIEAVVPDPSTGEFGTANIFGVLASKVGLETVVPIPDLFADTNGDGVLGTGDILYSVVDLNVYLSSIPTFTPGEEFDIVGGTVAGLPGMQFSSTPFSFDPNTGDFNGTPVTLAAFADAQHDPEAIPELSTWSLLATGFTLLAFLRWRDVRTRPSGSAASALRNR